MGPVLLLLLVSTVFSMINILSVMSDYSGMDSLCGNWRCSLFVFFYRLATNDRYRSAGRKVPRKTLDDHVFRIVSRSLQSIERSDCGFSAGVTNNKLYTLLVFWVLADFADILRGVWGGFGLHWSILSKMLHYCGTTSV
jgi:hypothetical protein